MVLCHTNDIMGCNYACYKWVGIFFMPLFFFVSGCLSKDEMTARKLANRIVGRLLIPYFVWGIIMQMLINNAFIHACIDGNEEVIRKHISEILLGEYLWYVPCLICIEILNLAIRKLSLVFHDKWMVRTVAILLSLAYLVNINEGHLPWHLDTACASMGFYQMGYFYFRYGSYLKGNLIAILLVAAFLVAAVYERNMGVVFDIHTHILTHPLVILASTIAGVFLFVNLCCNVNMGKWLSTIGINSLFIYIFHYKVLCILRPLAIRIGVPVDVYVVLIPFMVAASIAVCNLLVKPINRYCPISIGNKKLNLF